VHDANGVSLGVRPVRWDASGSTGTALGLLGTSAAGVSSGAADDISGAIVEGHFTLNHSFELSTRSRAINSWWTIWPWVFAFTRELVWRARIGNTSSTPGPLSRMPTGALRSSPIAAITVGSRRFANGWFHSKRFDLLDHVFGILFLGIRRITMIMFRGSA
jgi:hypothetical protein